MPRVTGREPLRPDGEIPTVVRGDKRRKSRVSWTKAGRVESRPGASLCAKCGFGARDGSLQVFVAAILSSLRSLMDCSNHEALGSRRLHSARGASIWALSQSEDFVLRTSP